MWLERGDNVIIGHNLTFKNCAPFTKCITKIYGTTIDHTEDLDLAIFMYNLLEYSSSYSDATSSLCFCSKDEATNFENDNAFKSFKYKGKLLGTTVADGGIVILKNSAIAAPSKYLTNFWRPIEILLVNCKVELKLKLINHCVLSALGGGNADANFNNIIFTIISTKLFVPFVTLPAKDNPKLTKFNSKGFEISANWNEHKRKSENKDHKWVLIFYQFKLWRSQQSFYFFYSNKSKNGKRYKTINKGIIYKT